MDLFIAIVLSLIGVFFFTLSNLPKGLSEYVDGLNPRLGRFLAKGFGGPRPSVQSTVADWGIVLGGAAVVGGWILVYKLRSFYWLTTTSDLYDFGELSTSWLKGHYMEENCFGQMLSFHAFINTPLLAIFVVPMGAMGLMVATAVAAFAGYVAMCQIMRHLGVPVVAASLFAAVASFTPLALHTYANVLYGFNPELMVPALALWLAYFALTRNWVGTLVMAVATCTVKEEYPLVVAVVGAVIVCEDIVASLDKASGLLKRINWPALVSIALAIVAIPALLLVIKLHPATGYSPGSFNRLKPVDGSELTGIGSLIEYLSTNAVVWLNPHSVGGWLRLVIPATFGLILLRPHFILLGFGLTIISWLMQDDLLWAPRFAGSLAFIQLVQALGFASLWGVASGLFRRGNSGKKATILVAAGFVVGCIGSFKAQLGVAPDSREVYDLKPTTTYSASERHDADTLFETYRRLGKPDEPVIAHRFLFRYAHDRNLYWADRLEGRPQPVWVLWDGPCVLDPKSYHLVGTKGRFFLYRRSP